VDTLLPIEIDFFSPQGWITLVLNMPGNANTRNGRQSVNVAGRQVAQGLSGGYEILDIIPMNFS